MFYTVFQFVTSRWTHVQQNRIENFVFDIVSKKFVILAFFRLIVLWQENAAKLIAMHRQICWNIITFN